MPDQIVPPSKVLVVYYSRTGTTAIIGDAIAAATGADVERLDDTVERSGIRGFLRSLRDARSRGRTTLKPLQVDPAAYELVVVGTPDWGKSVSAPVRAFLAQDGRRLRQVAFFLTNGRAEHEAVFREMASLAGRDPVACLGLPHDDVERGEYAGPVNAFVSSLPHRNP